MGGRQDVEDVEGLSDTIDGSRLGTDGAIMGIEYINDQIEVRSSCSLPQWSV